MHSFQPTSQSSAALSSIAVCALLSTCFAGSVLAQTSPKALAASDSSGSTQWGVGVAVTGSQELYRGAGNDNSGLPLLYVENAWLRIQGATADIKLGTWNLGSTSLNLTGRLKYAGDGYEAIDSPQLAGMEDRDGGLWGGATLSWNTPIARAQLEWLGDASSNSKGQQIQFQVDRRYSFGSVAVTPRIQAQWLDKKYVDYYFGVRAGEALAGRPQYAGKSAATFGIGLRFDYQVAPKQTVFLDLSTTGLPSAIKNSPIVERSSVSKVGVGYLYRF